MQKTISPKGKTIRLKGKIIPSKKSPPKQAQPGPQPSGAEQLNMRTVRQLIETHGPSLPGRGGGKGALPDDLPFRQSGEDPVGASYRHMKIPGKKLGGNGSGSGFLRLHPLQKSDGPHVIHGRDGQLGGEIGGQSQKVGMDRQAAVRKQGAGERPVLQAETAGIGEVLRKGKG